MSAATGLSFSVVWVGAKLQVLLGLLWFVAFMVKKMLNFSRRLVK